MLKNLLTSLLSSVPPPAPVLLTQPVRYRYFENKPRILKRHYGYEDKLAFRGSLPRIEGGRAIPQPAYVPKKNWAEPKAIFGQNDYIDILGPDPTVNPIKFQTGIPLWLKGFKGNEYQTLLRKRAFFGRMISASAPNEWKKMRIRIKYLYRTLNYNTKNFMDKKVLRR